MYSRNLTFFTFFCLFGKRLIFQPYFYLRVWSPYGTEGPDYEIDLEKYIKTMGMIRTGREEGREEGRLEAQKEIAQAMLKEGLPVEMISRITGIAVENNTRQQ